MSVLTPPVTTPKRAPRRARCPTSALQISFLVGRHATLGQAPPIQRRSTTAVRCPACAMCQASNLPLLPLPRIRTSNWSVSDIGRLLCAGGSQAIDSRKLHNRAVRVVCSPLGAVQRDCGETSAIATDTQLPVDRLVLGR